MITMKKYIALTAIVAGLISGFLVLEYQQIRKSQETSTVVNFGTPTIHDPTDVPDSTRNLPGTR